MVRERNGSSLSVRRHFSDRGQRNISVMGRGGGEGSHKQRKRCHFCQVPSMTLSACPVGCSNMGDFSVVPQVQGSLFLFFEGSSEDLVHLSSPQRELRRPELPWVGGRKWPSRNRERKSEGARLFKNHRSYFCII